MRRCASCPQAESSSGVDGVEDGPHSDKFLNAFETMWAIFWIVTTLGFDGYLGSGKLGGRLIIAMGLVAGLVFTTMPITIVGEAFREGEPAEGLIRMPPSSLHPNRHAHTTHASLSLLS